MRQAFTRGRTAGAVLVVLGLATAMHLDWHFARPAHHRLSLGWSQHWLIAIPAFALVAWYVCSAWKRQIVSASVAIIATAAFFAQVVEPLEELLVDGATFDWTFGPQRLAAFFTFTGVGIIAHIATVTALQRRERRAGA